MQSPEREATISCMGLGRAAIVAGTVLALLSCGTDAGSGSSNAAGAGGTVAGGAGGTSADIVCSLGTMYPNRTVIDPDAPVYSDSGWTQQQVTDAFAQAKAQNSQAYRAYKAANKYTQYLQCAWCACGCATSPGHKSAIDCYKDMHGFV